MYRHPPRVEPGAWVLAVMVALVAVAAGLLAWPTTEAAPAVSQGGGDGGLVLHRNQAVGYEVRYPDRWRAAESATVTRLLSPDRSTVVTVGVGPEGPLPRATDRLLESLRWSYRDVSLSGPEQEWIFGHPSQVVGGSATNVRGDRLRFLGIVLDGPDRNYAITVFVSTEADPARLLPDLRRIIESFRPPAT